MKNKIIYSLLLASSLLASNQKTPIPLSANYLSIENSGTLQPIDAYQDGIGIYTVEAVGANKVDNLEMNALVFKYGEVAKELNINIKEYVQTNGTDKEKILANNVGKFEPIAPAENTVCNDNNSLTINDKYTNGICVGTMIPNGTVCNDNNDQTINDQYTNGICAGNNRLTNTASLYTWDELNNLANQSSKAFVSSEGSYGSSKTGGIFDGINTNYTSGFYFSKHIENSTYGNTEGVNGFLIFDLFEKGRVWAGQWTGSYSTYYYDSDIDLFILENGIWKDVSEKIISVKGKKSAGKFTISSQWLEPGRYKIQRKNGVYASNSSYSTSTYEGLRADSEWFVEKY